MKLALNQSFSHQFTVDESVYNGFIEIFQDKNALHTEGSFAISKGFKGKVMHGNILNGFISYFIGELLPTEDVIILSQNINFKKPVYLNDVLDFQAVIVEQSEAVQLSEIRFTFKNEEKKTVAGGKIQIKEI